MKSVTARGQLRGWQWQNNMEVMAQGLSLLIVACFVLFSPLAVDSQLVALAFLPPLWIALRHGQVGALVATVAIDLLIALHIVWFANSPERWLELLSTLVVLSLVSLIVGLNVSQNRRDSTTLRAEASRLSTILDALPVLISYIDTNERYQFNNLAYQKWFNLPRAQITGKLVRSVIGEAPYQATKEQIHAALSGQPILSHIVHYQEPTERWSDITYIPDLSTVGNDVGTVKGFTTFVRDITKEIRVEHALGDMRQLNQTILEVTAVGISVYTPEGDCVLVNEAAAQNIGAPNVQAMAKNFHEIQSWRDYGILNMVNQVLATGVPHRQEFHMVTTFGKDVWIDFQAAILTANERAHLLLISDDISERINAEQELAQHRERLEELVQERTADLLATNLQLQQAMAERERAEQALRQSEEHFRLLTENAQDTIFRYDLLPQPRLAYVSPAVIHLTGYTPEEHIANQTLALELINQADGERLRDAMFMPSKFNEPLEIRWRRKDGSYIWAEQRTVAIYNEEKICVAVIGIIRDITQRRQMDEQLRKLSRAVEQSSVSITITDTEGAIEYVNPKFTQVTGYIVDDVYGKKPRILHPNNAQRVEAQQLQQTLLCGGEWRGELSNRTKTGKPYWESGVVSPIYDSHGRVTHFLSIMEDITQRKQQEREREALLAVTQVLRAANDSEEMLSLILQEVTTTFDATKTFFIAPDATTGEMVIEAAYEYGEFKPTIGVRIPSGKGVAAHVYRTSQPYVTDNAFNDPHFATPDLLGDAQAVICVPLVAQGMTIGLFSVARNAPMTSNDVRLLVAMADMAATGLQRATYHEETLRHAANLEWAVVEKTRELRQANERLQELDKLKSKFVSDVSHELLTPVTNMSLYLKLIKRKPEKQEQYLEILQEEAERIEALVIDILDLAQLDNKPVVVFSAVNINELLEGVVTAHQAKAGSRDLELSLHPTSNLPMIMGDPQKLIQVATNLVANALNYTASGYVRICTCQHDDQSVSFTVEDSGTGIYREDMPNLFQRFYRGRRDQIADVSGTGLGLSIVKELVDLHGGFIAIESEVGRGTTFTVTLPIALRAEQLLDKMIGS